MYNMSQNQPEKKYIRKESIKPDVEYRWAIVFGAFFSLSFVAGIFKYFNLYFFDEFMKQLNENHFSISILHTMLNALPYCFGLISTSLVNRWGCCWISIVGGVLGSASLLSSIFLENIIYQCFTIGIGLSLALSLICLSSIVSVTTNFHRRSIATGLTVCGSSVGALVFPLVLFKLQDKLTWKEITTPLAGISLVCAAFSALCRLPKNRTKNKRNSEEIRYEFDTFRSHVYEPSTSSETINTPERSTNDEFTRKENFRIKELMKQLLGDCLLDNNVFILFVFSNFFALLGISSEWYYVPIKASRNYNAVVNIISITSIFGCLFTGFLSEQLFVSHLTIYKWNLILCGTAMALSIFSSQTSMVALGASIYGLLSSGHVVLSYIVLADLIERKKFTSGFGIMALCGAAVVFIQILISEPLYAFAVNHRFVLPWSGVMTIFGGLITFLIPKEALHQSNLSVVTTEC